MPVIGATTHYEALGVARDATQAAVRAAWRRSVATVHPDHARGSDDEARRTSATAKLNVAWSVLGDPARRRAYDLTLVSSPRPVPDWVRPASIRYDPIHYATGATQMRSASVERLAPSPVALQGAGLASMIAGGALLTTLAALPFALPLGIALGIAGMVSYLCANSFGVEANEVAHSH